MPDSTPAAQILQSCLRAEDGIEALRQHVRQLQLHGLHNDEATTFARRFDELMQELAAIRRECDRVADAGEMF
jgi:hypothetical protein